MFNDILQAVLKREKRFYITQRHENNRIDLLLILIFICFFKDLCVNAYIFHCDAARLPGLKETKDITTRLGSA